MFTFAFVTGVKKGWAPKKLYGPAARKAWLGLVSHIDPDANVKDVCEGTNKGFSVQYYMDRKGQTGDLHGQAAASGADGASSLTQKLSTNHRQLPRPLQKIRG